MVRLREIPRTAAFAWSPGPNPILVTGTRSGAVDADFSDETKLELWDLNLDAPEQGLELQPLTSISTESRFYDIAWGAPSDEHPRGVVAGAMEDGSLQLWDAAKLLAGEEALMSRDTKHNGPVKALQFNPLRPQVLATAGSKGELFIWDINDTSTAFRLGTAAAHDIDCVAWNRKVSNILATGSAGGFVTVWDLKTKKASLTLNNNRKPVSSIAWDPNNSTNLLTATSDDNTPVILLWNLRNSQAPERTLQGHDQGVLSLSWCQQDPGLLLSCGKDNRTLVWNPQTGERYGEYPEATNWIFLTRFDPGNPNLMATASFDGKITIQTLQNTNPSSVPAAQNNLDDDDFFSKAPTQLQGASFSLPRAPVWLERPVGVSFGYGGKLVFFKKNDTPAGQPRSSKLQITSFSVDSDIGSATEKFEEAYKSGDIAGICDSHVAEAKTEEEKSDWQVLKALGESDGRTNILEYLGFSKEDEAAATEDEAESSELKEEEKETGLAPPQPNGSDGKKKHRRVISMWGDVDDGEDFLSDLTAAKGAKTDNPFSLLGEGAAEDQITKALIMGNFEKAVNICMKEDRIADAFILANCGGKDLVDKVQAAYLAQKKGTPSYLRLINSVVGKNLWDVVYNADLANWKETMVTLCTFADPAEFPDLCDALGDRIYESGSRKDASFCYLVGSKLEKVVDIWIAELQEAEKAGLDEASDDSTFSIHARSLQHFIEKVTVFRHVTKFADNEKNLTEGWKLASLYDKYTEYADIVAAHGQLSIAQRYLDLLPNNFPAAEVARNRVRLATQKAAPQVVQRQQAPTSRAASRAAAPVGYQAPASIPPVGPSPLNPYAPTQTQSFTPAANPYAPATTSQYQAPGVSPYGPTAGYAPSPPVGGGYGAPQPFHQPAHAPPPPRSTGPPPKIKKDEGQWNDVPMVTKPPVRRNTPSVAPITAAFPGQTPLQGPPPVGPYQRATPTPPPPPPKGSAPPRNMASPPVGPPMGGQHPLRSASVSSNPSASPYAPPPPPAGGLQTPMVPPAPRTASPITLLPLALLRLTGDRSHIPPNAQRLVEVLTQEMQRVAGKAPPAFAAQVKDTQKRLGLLFDHLNNGELVKPDTVELLDQIAQAIVSKNYEAAVDGQMKVLKEKTGECGQWMTGLKRLISMSKATT
ncbi:protein transport protein S31 [Collariella sp. IMI 366227]|nr:protein transport protein S31 [Collariella sp. IMI 366227]